ETSNPDKVTYMNRWIRFYRSIRVDFEADVRRACEGADAIVHNDMALAGSSEASRLDVPSLMTLLQPLGSGFMWGPTRRLVQGGYPTVYGFSRVLLPSEAISNEGVHVTGYWFLDKPPGWVPSPELRAFVEAGPPPVTVGFGSIPNDPREDLTALVLEALSRAGRRGVLVIGA